MQKLEQISKIVKLCKVDGADEFYKKMLNVTDNQEAVYSELLDVLKSINVGDLMNSSLKDIELIIDDIVDI